jgi:hypothetical protein
MFELGDLESVGVDLRRLASTLTAAEQALLDKAFSVVFEDVAAEEAPALADKIAVFAETCANDDRRRIRHFLNIAGGSLALRLGDRSDPAIRSAFVAIARYFNPTLNEAVVCRGSLREETPSTYEAIVTEAQGSQDIAQRRNNAWVVAPGPSAAGWIYSSTLSNRISLAESAVVASAKGTYVYYREPGDYVRPHIDVDEFALNALLLVSHSSVAETRSKLVLYSVDGRAKDVALRPGDYVVFRAAQAFHGRTAVDDGERVTVLTAGLVMH